MNQEKKILLTLIKNKGDCSGIGCHSCLFLVPKPYNYLHHCKPIFNNLGRNIGDDWVRFKEATDIYIKRYGYISLIEELL